MFIGMDMNKWMDVQDLLAGGMERKNGWTDGRMDGMDRLSLFLVFYFSFFSSSLVACVFQWIVF